MPERYPDKDSLIKTIQMAMGFEDCFSETEPCDCLRMEKCIWSHFCVSGLRQKSSKVVEQYDR